MAIIGIIAAVTANRVIGKNGKIPWNIPGEQSRFRELTTGNVVVMGRRTYDEIGHPLPGRYTIVISSIRQFVGQNVTTVQSLQQAITTAQREFPKRDIFIAGGASLYTEALPIANVLYITEIDAIIAGDVLFPEFNPLCYKKSTEKTVQANYRYRYVTYTRIEQPAP